MLCAAALLHAAPHPRYMIRHCLAGMHGVGGVITHSGSVFHYIGMTVLQSKMRIHMQTQRATQDLHIPWQPVLRCGALISAVEDACGLSMISDSPVASQPTGGSRSSPEEQASPGYTLWAAVHPLSVQCCDQKCGLDCALRSPELMEAIVTLPRLSAQHKPFFPLKICAVSLKRKTQQLNGENFVEDGPTQHIVPSSVLAWSGGLCVSAGYRLMMGRPRLLWPGVAPTPLCVSFPVLSIPLSTPSVCGMRECGSKKKKRRHFDCSCWPTSTICFRCERKNPHRKTPVPNVEAVKRP